MAYLESYLAGKRAAIESALDRIVPRADEPPERLHSAMRHSVFSGGKRLRPILALASYELVGGTGEAIMAPACALELIHTYSLIHDDLPAMDDDDTRRGRPTCHVAFGEALAILAGDALLTLAFEAVAGEAALDPRLRLAVIEEMARANGSRGMAGGQAADIEMEGAPPTLPAITFIHSNKSAAPIVAAVRVGAIAGGAAAAELDALTTYGRRAGLAFQIVDDLLDVTGSAEEMGKAVGKDVARGKMTYPAVVGVEAARQHARGLLGEAVDALAGLGEGARPLIEIAAFIVDRRH